MSESSIGTERTSARSGVHDHDEVSAAEQTAPTRAQPRPQLLFFYDAADGRARRVDGFLAQVLQRRGNHQALALRRVDVRKHSKLVERLGIHVTPSLVVIDEGRVQRRLDTPRGCEVIAKFLGPWLR